MKKFVLIIVVIILTAVSLYSRDFKGAEYRTFQTFLYGRFETRLKTPSKEGVLASFFTYYENTGINTWNEIDIEILGRYLDDVQFNTITPGQTNHVRHQFTKFNPALDYHTYAFEWTPNYVAWFIDGTEVYRQTGDHIATLNKAQKIMMNIWNPTIANWAGNWNANILPAFAYYDFVSYYSYTPGSGNYGSSNNFTHQWTDNFDSWDQTRWGKATHTFDGNNCDFTPANAVFENGKLILCLTGNVYTGHQDKKPPMVLWAKLNNNYTNKITVSFSEEIDSITGTNKNNFNIPNGIINSATLTPDSKNVVIDFSGIDTAALNNIIVTGIKDRSVTPNTIVSVSSSIIKNNILLYPVKINVGGNAALTYIGDKPWTANSEFGYIDGTAYSAANNIPINGTLEDQIFREERSGLASYKIRVGNGKYRIKLLFAENYFTQAGKRVYDIFIEDSLVFNNLDIYQNAGVNTALIKFYDFYVYDEQIDLHFAAEFENPLLNGIIIEKLVSGINESFNNYDKDFELYQNYPNPFNGTTKIQYALNSPQHITFEIFNTLGQKIYTNDLGLQLAGKHEITWNANNFASVSSGVYFYSIQGNNFRNSKKLILLK